MPLSTRVSVWCEPSFKLDNRIGQIVLWGDLHPGGQSMDDVDHVEATQFCETTQIHESIDGSQLLRQPDTSTPAFDRRLVQRFNQALPETIAVRGFDMAHTVFRAMLLKSRKRVATNLRPHITNSNADIAYTAIAFVCLREYTGKFLGRRGPKRRNVSFCNVTRSTNSCDQIFFGCISRRNRDQETAPPAPKKDKKKRKSGDGGKKDKKEKKQKQKK
eukprot:COSAG03_NODE_1364_length_4251_cov_4.775771_4_plen_217_part_00